MEIFPEPGVPVRIERYRAVLFVNGVFFVELFRPVGACNWSRIYFYASAFRRCEEVTVIKEV